MATKEKKSTTTSKTPSSPAKSHTCTVCNKKFTTKPIELDDMGHIACSQACKKESEEVCLWC